MAFASTLDTLTVEMFDYPSLNNNALRSLSICVTELSPIHLLPHGFSSLIQNVCAIWPVVSKISETRMGLIIYSPRGKFL